NYTAEYLAAQLAVAQSRLTYTAAGVNHLTWFTDVKLDGADAIAKLRDIARETFAKRQEGVSPPRNLFSWQCLDLFGAFPAVLDRHVTEFFPAQFARKDAYYGQTLGIDVYSFENTIARGDATFAGMTKDALSPEPLPADYFERIGGEHEQVLDIIASLRGPTPATYSMNLPNAGQVPNLPEGAIVESPVVAMNGTVTPERLAPLDAALAGPLMAKLEWDETIVDAALAGSRAKFVQALLIDGAPASTDDAANLADALLAAQKAHLPQFG
ncbi:MAG: hypothetical protein ACREB3_03705, partial [Burkholderiales bacterium]